MKDFEEKINDQDWLLTNLERQPTFLDRLKFCLQTRFNRRPYKSFRCISIRGGFLPKLFLYNGLVNSKYNIFTFIPLVLYSQFRSFINLFYLSMCLSQLIPILRVESPIVHMFPLSLVIFVYSLKEGIEDYKRHVRDKEHNRQTFSVYSEGGYTDVTSENIKLGQLLMLKQGQRVPADILLLKTSEPNGSSFVRTDQLDGETDWKLKRAVATTQLMSVEDMYNLFSVATVEEPKPDFYNFTGKITFYHPTTEGSVYGNTGDPSTVVSDDEHMNNNGIDSATNSSNSALHITTTNNNETNYSHTSNVGNSKSGSSNINTGSSESNSVNVGKNHRNIVNYDLVVESLNVDNVVWMNSIVASGTIHGLVIYVGKDARACINSKRSRAKNGLFDKELNTLFVILILLMLGMTILMLAPTGFEAKWYITFLKYLLLFSTIVPLSLRISLDIARYVYNRGIVLDKKIPQAMPRTTMIPEELGRIQYLLSDKTGTLTQNVISLEKLYVSRGFYSNEDVETIKDKMNSFLSQSMSTSGGTTGRTANPTTTPTGIGSDSRVSSAKGIRGTNAESVRGSVSEGGITISGRISGAPIGTSGTNKPSDKSGSVSTTSIKGGPSGHEENRGLNNKVIGERSSSPKGVHLRDEKEVIRDIFSPNLGESLESRLCLALLSMGICHNVRPISSTDDATLSMDSTGRRRRLSRRGSKSSITSPVRTSSYSSSTEGVKLEDSDHETNPQSVYKHNDLSDSSEKVNEIDRRSSNESSQHMSNENTSGDEKVTIQSSAPEKEEENVEFQASSPDEIALVKFAHLCGFKLVHRDDYCMHLLVNGLLLVFKILFMIPFSSETKRMGIVVEDACGGKHFFIKGAEVVIIPFLLPRGSVWLSEECDNLARMGLRTLVFGYRTMSDNEFSVFMAKYREANVSLEDRVRKIRNVTSSLEHGLHLVGLTGVRDQLQKNVPATLESLRNAGIKIWMLTGDKIDTAKCVAISAGLKQKHHTIYQISVESLLNPQINPSDTSKKHHERVEKEIIDFINSYDLNAHCGDNSGYNSRNDSRGRRLRKWLFRKSSKKATGTPYGLNPQDPIYEEREYYESCIEKVAAIIEWNLEHFRMGPTDSVLILDSFVIAIALDRLKKLFLKSSTMASSVLCCRCTPQMKADIVKLLKSNKQIVCCIGDGDNDVPMITEANVGVGIVGKEGLQASLSSDYSLVEFSHIKRLLLWHGRNSYKRSSKMSHFLMHRGVILSVMQAIFSSIYYFMPIAFFQGWLLVGFTSYYNMIPIFCLVLDVEISEDDVLLFPELYHEIRGGRVMNVKTFLIWIWISVFQGTVLMTGAIILFENSLVSLIAIGCTSLFILEILNLVSELNEWHRLTIIGIVSTSVVYFYSLLVFRNNFDMEFIARKSFLWKVLLISFLGWTPIYSVKWLTNLLKPPQYVKLIVS